MTISTIHEPQRNAAKVEGFTYLLAMATAVYAEMFLRGQFIVPDNIAETARNIMSQGRLWRVWASPVESYFGGYHKGNIDNRSMTDLYIVKPGKLNTI